MRPSRVPSAVWPGKRRKASSCPQPKRKRRGARDRFLEPGHDETRQGERLSDARRTDLQGAYDDGVPEFFVLQHAVDGIEPIRDAVVVGREVDAAELVL